MTPTQTPDVEPTIICDRREQLPLQFPVLKSEPGTLKTGDYSLKNYEDIISVERKSLSDLVACCGRERDRFEREIERLLKFPSKLLLVESSISQIMAKNYRGTMHPNAVLGSLLGWMEQGIPVLFTGSHANAAWLCEWYLKIAARHRLPELKIAT